MTALAAPLGLIPSYHPSGLERARQYNIAQSYGTSIFKGDPVILSTATGTITIGTAAAALLGVFQGVEYTDVTGKPTYSNFWPGAQLTFTGIPINAFVTVEVNTVYEIQAAGPMPQTSIGKEFDIVMGTGNTATGLSNTALSTVAATPGTQKQFRVLDFGKTADNAANDNFTIVRVVLAQPQLSAVSPSL